MVSTRLLFILLALYIISMVLLFRYDPTGRFAVGGAVSVAMSFFGLGILFILLMMSLKNDMVGNIFGLSTRNIWSIVKVASVIAGIIALFIATLSLVFGFVKNPPMSRAFFSVVNTVIFSVTLLFVLYFFKDYSFESPHMQLLKNAVMYIPCMVYDMIEWAKYQYSITTPTAYIILALDVGIILLNNLWKKIQIYYEHRQKEDGLLLEGPVFLNEEVTLGTFENMMEIKNNRPINYHYGLSFKIYINPQPPSTSSAYSEYTKIFDYGGKPKILYKADENKIKIQMKINENETQDIYVGDGMKLQKWNHFVINYDGGTLDVILNGDLVASKSSVAPYMTLDVVSVGQNNGINGGIRDVLYFRKPVV